VRATACITTTNTGLGCSSRQLKAGPRTVVSGGGFCRCPRKLAGTDLALSSLAISAGFSNASHLSIVFRQETGMTPTAYRSQFRGRTNAFVADTGIEATSRPLPPLNSAGPYT
jgi:Bacterial regulatory helix-turn-helix proteins, AraC family